jgi:hypothetical protein
MHLQHRLGRGGARSQQEAGQASGATSTIREIGGVPGVAVLSTVFTGAGDFRTPQAYVDGLIPRYGWAPWCWPSERWWRCWCPAAVTRPPSALPWRPRAPPLE